MSVTVISSDSKPDYDFKRFGRNKKINIGVYIEYGHLISFCGACKPWHKLKQPIK